MNAKRNYINEAAKQAIMLCNKSGDLAATIAVVDTASSSRQDSFYRKRLRTAASDNWNRLSHFQSHSTSSDLEKSFTIPAWVHYTSTNSICPEDLSGDDDQIQKVNDFPLIEWVFDDYDDDDRRYNAKKRCV